MQLQPQCVFLRPFPLLPAGVVIFVLAFAFPWILRPSRYGHVESVSATMRGSAAAQGACMLAVVSLVVLYTECMLYGEQIFFLWFSAVLLALVVHVNVEVPYRRMLVMSEACKLPPGKYEDACLVVLEVGEDSPERTPFASIIVDDPTHPPASEPMMILHKVFAAALGIVAQIVSFFLLFQDYQGSTVAWALVIAQFYALAGGGVSMVFFGLPQHGNFGWTSLTSHFERQFFVCFAILLAGTPGW